MTRDFAFLVDAALPAGDLVRTVKGADKANIVAVRLFDDFRGDHAIKKIIIKVSFLHSYLNELLN